MSNSAEKQKVKRKIKFAILELIAANKEIEALKRSLEEEKIHKTQSK